MYVCTFLHTNDFLFLYGYNFIYKEIDVENNGMCVNVGMLETFNPLQC